MGTTAHPEPTARSHDTPASSPAALVAFARLLARQAAQQAFAKAEPAAASESDHFEPEDNHEAED